MKSITEEEAKLDGFESSAELRAAMERHYSRITDNNWVTVIEFEPVGALVSAFEERFDKSGSSGYLD